MMNIKSLQLLNNFGLVLILLLIISTLYDPLLCQSKKIAIVSNLNKEGNFDFTKVEQITSLLNNEVDLSVIIFIGEISKSGSIAELTTLKSELEKLKTPYCVIGGYNNYFGIYKYSSDFNQVFENDEFVLNDNNKILIGINSVIPDYPENAFIKVESINKILEELKTIKYSDAYIIANNSLSITQNAKNLLSLLKNKKTVSFYPTEKSFSAQLNSDYNILEIGIPPSINFDDINYFLIEEIYDTIHVVKKTNKKDLPEIQYSISLSDLNLFNLSIDQLKIDSSLTKIFEIKFNTSSTTGNITSANRIYTSLDNGLIYLSDLSGKEKFVTELMGTIKNNPVLYKDLLLVATVEADLYSINSNTGEVLQVVGIGENITSDLSLTEIDNSNIKSKAVVFGTSKGNIFCYDAFSFELLWKNNISKIPIISTPSVENDKVVFLNSNSSLYCVNAKSGSLNWKYEFSDKQIFSPKNYPLCDGKNVFSISSEGNLFAIDLLLGRKTWSINTKGVLNQFYITSDKQSLVLLNNIGIMTFFSAKDGKEIQRLDFKKSGLFSFIITENEDNLFVGFSDGSLYIMDKKFVAKQLISPNQIPITSINALSKNEFIIKDLNGNLTFYKIN
jgi:outer membrane protein assembly factor BamB